MLTSNFYGSLLLNTFNGITAQGRSELWIGLFQTDPGPRGDGGIEITYEGYTRQPITFSVPYLENNNITIINDTDILWEKSPSNAGEVRYIGIFDSPVIGAGNMYLRAELTIPMNIRENHQPSILQSDTQYEFLGNFTDEFKTRALNVLRGITFAGMEPHLALFSGDPQEGGAEMHWPSYERVGIDFAQPSIQNEVVSLTNTNLLRFPTPTITAGLKSYAAIMDSSTGGQPMTTYRFTIEEIIHPNYVPQVNIGDVFISLS